MCWDCVRMCWDEVMYVEFWAECYEITDKFAARQPSSFISWVTGSIGNNLLQDSPPLSFVQWLEVLCVICCKTVISLHSLNDWRYWTKYVSIWTANVTICDVFKGSHSFRDILYERPPPSLIPSVRSIDDRPIRPQAKSPVGCGAVAPRSND